MQNNNNISQALDNADRLAKEGKLNEAVGLLEKLYAQHPDEESILLRLAWASWDLDDKERSIKCWETLLDRELQRQVFTGFAYDELVRICKQKGDLVKLVDVCEKAVLVQPDDTALLEELGKAYLLSGQNEKACATLKKLTTMEPDNAVYYCRLGEALIRSDRCADGENAYEQAARIDPDIADRYLMQAADLYLKTDRPEAAYRLAEKSLSLSPDNSLYHCFLGDVLIALNQSEQAFARYEDACRVNPPQAGIYFNRLGHALMKAGLPSEAVRAFETALSRDNTLPCQESLEKARKAADGSFTA